MAAPKGNRFWEFRATHGRDKIFSDEESLWESACKYFEWVEDTPLWETKVTQYQGDVIEMPIAKMRAMTIEGLCLYLNISTQTWRDYAKRDDFIGVTSKIENVIKSQKFAGAAADLLNANIIARDLGLKEKSEQEVTVVDELNDEERADRLAALYDKARARRAEQSGE